MIPLPMRNGLVVVGLASALVVLLAVRVLRRGRPTTPVQHLQYDLVMSLGMTSIGWCVTCVALLLNPLLGADEVIVTDAVALYSISRGTCMLAFWVAVGFAAFLLRQIRRP